MTDCTKSAALGPLIGIDDKVTAAAELFFSVTALTALVLPTPWFPNARLTGVTARGSRPVPVMAAVCGLPAELSVIVTEAERAPPAVGVNVMVMEQLPDAGTLVPQLFVCPKSPEFAPVTVMPEIDRTPNPGLDSVMVLAALVVPVT